MHGAMLPWPRDAAGPETVSGDVVPIGTYTEDFTSPIRASIQSSKKARRVAERPHCAAFCHNRPFMPQQTSQNTTTSQRGLLDRSPMIHGSWDHGPTIQHPHGPIGHHSPTVPQSKGPSPILSHKLRHKPKPDLTHQPGLPGTKNISQTQKATRLGGFKVSMVSEAGFEPARPVCGH